jgi:hypothetical protein
MTGRMAVRIRTKSWASNPATQTMVKNQSYFDGLHEEKKKNQAHES